MAIKSLSRCAAALITASCLSASGLLAQTVDQAAEEQVHAAAGRASSAAKPPPKSASSIRSSRTSGSPATSTTLGDRLVAAAPAELKQPVYEYSFTPVNLKEINAFALPGGPMFVHRGMFDAAASEGEVVGRDGARAVARAAAARHRQRVEGAEPLAAARPDRRRRRRRGRRRQRPDRPSRRAASSAWARCCCATAATSRSRPICSARRSWRAPATTRARSPACSRRSSASRRASGGSGPQWMSSHPNPGNRTQYITREAESADDRQRRRRARVRSRSRPRSRRCRRPSRWPSSRKRKSEPAGTSALNRSARPGQPVPRPSAQYRSISGGRVFQADVPVQLDQPASKQLDQGRSAERLRPAERPDGVQPRRRVRRRAGGIARSAAKRPTTWLRAVAQNNPELRLAGEQQSLRISQRSAIGTPLVNPSPLGGQERIGRLHDVPGGRHAVLLPDDRAGEGRRGLPGGVPDGSASRSG